MEEDESLPEAYDARKLGIVTSVKDQGKFNTCWAYGAVACAESNMLIKKLATLEEADFSERHLAYFVFNIPKDPLGNAVGDKEVLTGERDYMIGAGMTSEAGSAEEMSISLERDSIKLLVQDKKRFKLKTFKISGAKNILIEWKTSDEKVARIKGLGIVEALSPGKCVITASSENGGEASCTVTILARPVKVEGLQCVNAASTAARIQWEKQPDISGYIVFRYNEVTQQWNEIKRIKCWEKNIYVDKGLTPGNSYWYAVRAYSDAEKEVLAESSELLYVTTKK